jgi:hypothetical protein
MSKTAVAELRRMARRFVSYARELRRPVAVEDPWKRGLGLGYLQAAHNLQRRARALAKPAGKRKR